MRDVPVSLQVSNKTEAFAHGVGSGLRRVDRHLHRSSQLQLVRLDRNDLDQWHLLNEFLGSLDVQAVLLIVIPSTFEV